MIQFGNRPGTANWGLGDSATGTHIDLIAAYPRTVAVNAYCDLPQYGGNIALSISRMARVDCFREALISSLNGPACLSDMKIQPGEFLLK
jgi:hypothetical protein